MSSQDTPAFDTPAFDAPVFEAPVFEAVIVPHRSLGPAGLRVLVGLLCLLSGATSLVFWLLGAWPVMGFCGAEMLLAVVLLRRNARARRGSEMLLLSAGGLRIVRTTPDGRRTEQALPAAWLRAVLEERPGRAPLLLLCGRGVRFEVGAALGEAERRELAAALQAALHRQRHPTFDNPQLGAP